MRKYLQRRSVASA